MRPADISLEDMAAHAEDTAALLRAIAHPARLLVLCCLTGGEFGVSAIEGATGVRQPILSRELQKLRESGLVASRRESRAMIYRLADDRVHALLTALCDLQLPGPSDPSSHH